MNTTLRNPRPLELTELQTRAHRYAILFQTGHGRLPEAAELAADLDVSLTDAEAACGPWRG